MAVSISSINQLDQLIEKTRSVVVAFYLDVGDWKNSLRSAYDNIAQTHRANKTFAFLQVDCEKHPTIATHHKVSPSQNPTFVFFQELKENHRISLTDPAQLLRKIKHLWGTSLFTEAASSKGDGLIKKSASSVLSPSSMSNVALKGCWLGVDSPRGYSNITDQVEKPNVDVMNYDTTIGTPLVLFGTGKPTGFSNDQDWSQIDRKKWDWIESDVDSQLMIYIPFRSALKVHSIHLTSCKPSEHLSNWDLDDRPCRPKKIRLYTNISQPLDFDQADSTTPIQEFELTPDRWTEETHTATLDLRFVSFQRVWSMVIYVVDGDTDENRTRIDRIRIMGEAGQKMEVSRIGKMGENPPEMENF